MSQLEQRTVDVDVERVGVEGDTLSGYAAVFNTQSEDLGGFRERIAPGAFAGVLDDDVRLLVDHKPPPLARTKAGTLRLQEDDTGLYFEADLPQTSYARDLRESVRRGDLDGMSFRFTVDDEEWNGDLRTVRSVKELSDVCLATYPAYPAASVELRTRPEPETEERQLEQEKRNGGGLRVADADATAEERTIEERVREALASVRKGESRALAGSATDPITPPDLSTLLFEKLRATSVALRSGVRVITTDREAVQWPKLSGDVSPDWYAETDTITAGDPSFTTVTATPRKLAHRVEFSNEAIDDSTPDVLDTVNGHLVTMLGLKLDAAIYEGSGTAPMIRGLKNVSGIQTVDMGTDGASLADLDPIADAVGLLEAENVPGPYVVVMPPRNWATIRKFKDTTDAPLMTATPSTDAPQSVFGNRVYVSGQLTITETRGSNNDANSIYVYAPREVIVVRRQDAQVELDRSRLFDKDMSEMRGKLRADLIVPNPTGVVRIVGVRP